MCNCLFLFGWFGNLCLLLPVVYCLGLYGLIVSFTSCPFLSCLVFSLFDKSSLVLSYLLLSCLVFISWVLSCHVVLYPDLFRSFLVSYCFVLSFTHFAPSVCLYAWTQSVSFVFTIRLLRVLFARGETDETQYDNGNHSQGQPITFISGLPTRYTPLSCLVLFRRGILVVVLCCLLYFPTKQDPLSLHRLRFILSTCLAV